MLWNDTACTWDTKYCYVKHLEVGILSITVVFLKRKTVNYERARDRWIIVYLGLGLDAEGIIFVAANLASYVSYVSGLDAVSKK